MFKILRFCMLSLLLLLGGVVVAQELTPYKSLTFPDENKANNKVSSYSKTWTAKIDDDSWSISNFNNNSWNGWSYIKCGSKSNASVATIINDNTFDEPIQKVVANLSKVTTANVNSVKLIVASDNACSNVVETIDGSFGAAEPYNGSLEFTVKNPAKGLYYKLEFDCEKGSGNGFVQVNSVDYYSAASVSAPKMSESSKTFSEPFDVTITAQEGADIYYTLDGNDPTTSSTKYNGSAISITETCTLKAFAVKNGESSSVVSATYTFLVAAPTFSEDSKTFSEPFDVTITAQEGADIYYTLDGNDPTTSSTKYNGSAISITETCTLKAIAVKNGESSSVVSATYTYRQALDHDGSFTSPLTAEELIANAAGFVGKDVWVKGSVLGTLKNSQLQSLQSNSTNIVLGESGTSNYIPISLKSNTSEKAYCNANADDLMGKELLFFGTIGTYFSLTGIPNGEVKAFAGPEDSPIASLSVKTDEGYATFVSDYAFYVPEGVECATITGADENGVLSTNYKYKAGYSTNNIVPANYPVLVKADGKKTFNLALASGKGSSAGTNLLQAGTDADITAEAGHRYYKLAYDNFETKEGLGFYWGAAEGGAFYVPKGNAYLDVPSISTTSVMSFRLEDAVTGIATTVANGQTENVAYTIDGRRVDASHLSKGLYIVNGKKVMVK